MKQRLTTANYELRKSIDNLITFTFLLSIYMVFAMLFSGCGRQQIERRELVSLTDLPQVDVSAETDSVIEIKSWLAVGPFTFNPFFSDPALSFDRNDLKRYGIREGMLNDANIEKLQKRGAGVFLINVPSPQLKLLKYISGKIENKSNYYLVARIHSSQSREATLIIDGSNSYAVWLNEDKLLEVRGKYNLNKAGDRFVNVSLKEGENLLFVKVGRVTNKRSWDFICAITSLQEGERIFRVNYAGDFVVNPIVNNTLDIYAGPYRNGRIEMVDTGGQIVADGSFENLNTNDKPFTISDINRFEDGFYKTILTVGDERIEQIIYKGNYAEFVKKTKAIIDKMESNSPYVKDLTVALQRVDHLHEQPGDPNSPSETRFINRNRVFWGYSLHRLLNNDAETQLMTYENPEGVFIFHHTNRQQQSISLIIIVPFTLEGSSLIEDWYTSNLDQIETDNALADEYGFAVAWIYAGGKNYSASKTEKEIAAVINRLNSEYNIDNQRLYIMGDCEGGRRALVQLSLYPDRYVAYAAVSPITLSGGNDGIPIELVSQMGHIPILIKHGTNDDMSPVENSRRFYAEAKKYGMPVKYIENESSHVHINRDFHRFAFEFFSRIASGQK